MEKKENIFDYIQFEKSAQIQTYNNAIQKLLELFTKKLYLS